MNLARVYFKGGQYAAVSADTVFDAVAAAFGARSILRSVEVEKVEMNVMHRYQTEPDYV